MRVEHMTSTRGNKVPNQLKIENNVKQNFQSYDMIICEVIEDDITLDIVYWDYSRTTSRYLGAFLNVPSKTIKKRVSSGEYKLRDLNYKNR